MATKQPSLLSQLPPGFRPVILLLGIAAAVAVGITLFFWWRTPQWSVLFTGVPTEDVPAIATALEAGGIQHKLESNSGAVMVPAADLDAARLKLAAQGLPKSDGNGFGMMRENPGFGVSQFMEAARYQHAIEQELARTIVAVDAVAAARVHLALPRQSAFVRERRPGSASVMVQLKPGRQLESGQVAAITHLVASSIPELEPAHVTIVDQKGRLLSAPGNGATDDGEAAYAAARRIEATYVERIEALLTPLVGIGRVRAQVVADLEAGALEEAREQYRPESAVVRSESTSESSNGNGAVAAGGVPGALTNQPPPAGTVAPVAAARQAATQPAAAQAGPPAPAGAATTAIAATTPVAAPSATAREATRNFEIDRTVSYVRQPPGRVRRMTVAVLLDHALQTGPDGKAIETALTPKQLEDVTRLVKDAVGFDATRGDSVNVMNAPFVSDDGPIAEPEPVPIWQRPVVLEIAKTVLGALLLLALAFGVLKPLMRSLVQQPRQLAMAGTGAAVVAGAPMAADGQAPALTAQPQVTQGANYDQQLTQARQLVNQDPKRVAQVVKTWVASDE